MYFKITNENECHHNFQYVDGLNILKEPFNDDPNSKRFTGGLYFADVKNIFEYIEYGVYLREVILPTENKEFKMVTDHNGGLRANMIMLGKKYDLFEVETFKYLIENGADIHTKNDHVITICARLGHSDIVKYLIENGVVDIDAGTFDNALSWSSRIGDLEMVKYLIGKGANINSKNNKALYNSIFFGNLEIVKYLVENGADIHADNNYALYLCEQYWKDDIKNYLLNYIRD
jgi:hypothetical protein